MTEEFDYSPLHSDFHVLSKPAQRALITDNFLTPETIAASSEKELLRLHGMGPKSMPMIREILSRHDLDLKKA